MWQVKDPSLEGEANGVFQDTHGNRADLAARRCTYPSRRGRMGAHGCLAPYLAPAQWAADAQDIREILDGVRTSEALVVCTCGRGRCAAPIAAMATAPAIPNAPATDMDGSLLQSSGSSQPAPQALFRY
jgi:hypothetical protein